MQCKDIITKEGLGLEETVGRGGCNKEMLRSNG
jgi:hypothetical protein